MKPSRLLIHLILPIVAISLACGQSPGLSPFGAAVPVHAQTTVPGDENDKSDPPPATPITSQDAMAAPIECPATRSSSQHPSPKCNDITYVVDKGVGLDTGCTFRRGGPLRFSIEVKRFPGDLNKLIQNKLISPKAVLRMPAYDVDYGAVGARAPERDRITFNGKVLNEFLTGENDLWKLNTFYIPIEEINFASSTQQPGLNEIVIDIDTANTTEEWCTAIDWATLSIELAPPVLMVHGILSKGETWTGPWTDKLTSLGLPFDTIDLGGPAGIALDSIQSNSHKIADKVAELRKQWGVDQIRILAHSKGGIDSRHYIEQNDTVGTLVQLGTPNAGSPLADIAQSIIDEAPLIVQLGSLLLPAGYQLTTDYMETYNRWHGFNGKTKYVSLAGDYKFGNAADSVLTRIHDGPNDAIVPQWSVWALPYAIKPGYASVGTDKSAMHTGQTRSSQIRDQLLDYFLELRRNPEFEQAAPLQQLQQEQQATMASAALALSPTQTLVGSILAGEIRPYLLTIDAANAAQFLLYQSQGSLTLTLESPSGVQINPSTAGIDYAVIGEPGLGFVVKSYQLASPEVGVWKLIVSSPATNPAGEAIPFFVAGRVAEAAVQMQASTNKDYYRASESVTVSVRLTDNASPILSATVSAVAQNPAGVTQTVVLHDDGVGADKVASDGVYAGPLSNTVQAGIYKILVRAAGAPSKSFNREAVLGITVAASQSGLRQPFTSNGLDTDQDGLYNNLVVRTNVTVTLPTTYTVRGILKDKNGREIDSTTTITRLLPGNKFVNLNFDGSRIYKNGVDGPYVVSTVQLAEEGEAEFLPLVELTNAHTTAALSHKLFQRPALTVLSSATDQGVDTNANGLFNRLDVSLTVNVRTAGAYEWTGLLLDGAGRELGFASGKGSLVADDNVLVFSFDSDAIAYSKSNGPYYMNSVLIYSNSTSAVVFEAHQTGAYSYQQFELTRRRFYLPDISAKK